MYSAKFERVKGYFTGGMWNETMVQNAVGRWITAEEAHQILGGSRETQDGTAEASSAPARL